MHSKLQDLLEDNYSGSFTLSQNALSVFLELINQTKPDLKNLEKVFDEIHEASKILIKHQSNMVLLRKSSNAVITYFKRLLKTTKNGQEIISSIVTKIESLKKELEDNIETIAVSGAKIITNFNKIMTISNSTAVTRIFRKAEMQRRKFEVFCLKSHPPDEGILLAEALVKKGMKTTLVADSQASVVMDQMNLVLIGADRLYENGFVNKAGTYSLCLLAKQFNVPVYLAVETMKILKENERSIKSADRDPREVYSGKNKNIEIVNSYFEKIPLNAIHKVICEEGVFETQEFINWYLGD